MNSKERIISSLNGNKPDRVPFAPAIYEHKAALINKTPSEVCKNHNLLFDAIEAEYEIYHPDILVVGIDIYNIEAEAIGCKINYNQNNEVPTIKTRILSDSNLQELKIPNPQNDGRMPLILDVTRRIQNKYGNDVYVCAGVSGPFSLASSLMGDENLLITTIEDQEYLTKILKYTTDVLKEYSKAILETGADVIVFDSASAPPLVSPIQYKEFILPFIKDIFAHLKNNGSKFLSYIVGGNTIDNVDSYIEAGIKNIICDFNADLKDFINKAKNNNITIRKNFNPSLLLTGNEIEIKNQAMKILELSHYYNGLIFGTGILPYNIDKDKVIFLRDLVTQYIL